MKKVTSFLLATFTSVIFASSAMAATTHHTAPHPTHQVAKQHTSSPHSKHHQQQPHHTQHVTAQTKSTLPSKPITSVSKKIQQKAKA